jgi:hypothetical protein
MPIPSVAKWQKKTSSCLHSRKNPLILDIDILLAEYHDINKTDAQKQKILILMLYICTEWLVNKSWNNWRRPYVKDLIDEIEAELRTSSMLKATQDRLTGDGKGIKLHEDPIELLQPKDRSTKFGLSGASQFQRYSGSDAKGLVSSWGNRTGLTGHAKKLKQRTVTDYVDELRIMAAANAANLLTKDLAYLSKSERLNLQLEQDDTDQLFHLHDDDQPYTSPNLTDAGDLYVMDTCELIYVSSIKAAGRFHHSSFFSGRPVLCGGNIKLVSGNITFISNTSGHYRPSVQDLLQCVTILRDKYGCDLTRIRVEVTKSQFSSDTFKSAEVFLKRQGVPEVRTIKVTAV